MLNKGVLWQFSKYAAIGALGFSLDLGLFFVFTRIIGLNIILANILSVAIVIGHNFLWHKYLTFKAKSSKMITTEFRKFFVVSGTAFLIQQFGLPVLVLLPLETLVGEWEDFLAKFILVVIVGVSSFYINRVWTFRAKLA